MTLFKNDYHQESIFFPKSPNFFQISPVRCRKSRVYCQKSPIFSGFVPSMTLCRASKTTMSATKSSLFCPNSIKRAMYSAKKALHSVKRALYLRRRIIHDVVQSIKDNNREVSKTEHSIFCPTFCQKSPIFTGFMPSMTLSKASKTTIIGCLQPEIYILPYILSRQKRPAFCQKSPVLRISAIHDAVQGIKDNYH